MIIIMQATASAREVAAVTNRMRDLGGQPEIGEAAERVIVSDAGAEIEADLRPLRSLPALAG